MLGGGALFLDLRSFIFARDLEDGRYDSWQQRLEGRVAETDTDPQLRQWHEMVARARREPETPFDEQWRLFSRLAAERPPERGPLPAWWPTPERIAKSNIGWLMREVGARSYGELHLWSVEHRSEFWSRK